MGTNDRRAVERGDNAMWKAKFAKSKVAERAGKILSEVEKDKQMAKSQYKYQVRADCQYDGVSETWAYATRQGLSDLHCHSKDLQGYATAFEPSSRFL